MWRIWWASNNASRWQMGFNSAFKGLIIVSNNFLGITNCKKLNKEIVDQSLPQYTRVCLQAFTAGYFPFFLSFSSICTLRCGVVCVVWKWHFLRIRYLHYRSCFSNVWFDPLLGTWRVCHLIAGCYSLSSLLPPSSRNNKIWTRCHLHPDALSSTSFRGQNKELSVTQRRFYFL